LCWSAIFCSRHTAEQNEVTKEKMTEKGLWVKQTKKIKSFVKTKLR
jgi:hypothetical protein